MAVKKANFTVNTTHIFFDANGDPSIGYDIVYWSMNNSTDIKTIGEYWPNGGIKIPHYLVKKMGNVNVRSRFHLFFISQNHLMNIMLH